MTQIPAISTVAACLQPGMKCEALILRESIPQVRRARHPSYNQSMNTGGGAGQYVGNSVLRGCGARGMRVIAGVAFALRLFMNPFRVGMAKGVCLIVS